MKKLNLFVVTSLTWLLFILSFAPALGQAAGITDREIIERLTKVETKLDSLDQRMERLDQRMDQFREDMNSQFDRIDSQFNRLTQIMLGILGAFVVLVAGTIGFALWDRRTMIRPFETKVKEIEEGISSDRNRLDSLLEAFRALGKRNEEVAEILKRFNLL